jgi:hypothetical protein
LGVLAGYVSCYSTCKQDDEVLKWFHVCLPVYLEAFRLRIKVLVIIL